MNDHPYLPPREPRPPKTWLGSSAPQRIRFELVTALADGSAIAKVRHYNRAAASLVASDNESLRITLYDTEGRTAEVGAVGRAEWMADAHRWEIYELLGGDPPIIYGVLNEDLTAGGSAEITIHDAGGATAETETVFDNVLDEAHYLPEGRLVWAVPHRADGCYYVIQTKGCALEVEA